MQIIEWYEIKVSRACRLMGVSRSGFYKKSRAKDRTALSPHFSPRAIRQ